MSAHPSPGASVPPPHAHYMEVHTAENRGHAHLLQLFTYPTNGGANDGHIHWYQGTTDHNAGHFHRVVGMTGPAIALPGGDHYHVIESEVDSEPFELQGGYYETVQSIPRHVHSFSGRTTPPIGQEPPDW